jgi:hypothetical protein
VTLDPKLTVVRSRDIGAEFYDSVMRRMSRNNLPSGVMFHFSGTFEDQFFAVSAYPDQARSTTMFADSTSPQIANEIGAYGGGPDISRDEFDIVRYVINTDHDLQGFRFAKPGEFAAVLVTEDTLTRERYLATSRRIGFPEEWPDGLIIHVAGSVGDHLAIFDLWRASGNIASFYGQKVGPALLELYPEVNPAATQSPGAIAVHSLYINESNFSGQRDYLREV